MRSCFNDIDAVFFDLDDTLILHQRELDALAGDTFDAFASHLSHLERAPFLDTFFAKSRDLWYMMEDGVLPGDVAEMYAFINTLRSLDAPESLARSMHSHFEQLVLENTVVMDCAVDVMKALGALGKAVAIVTNGYGGKQRRKARYHGLDQHVAFVMSSEDAGCYKPLPGIFEKAAQRVGARPECCVFVGDMISTDIRGAHAAGMKAVLIDVKNRWGDRLAAGEVESPDMMIRALPELLSVIHPAKDADKEKRAQDA